VFLSFYGSLVIYSYYTSHVILNIDVHDPTSYAPSYCQEHFIVMDFHTRAGVAGTILGDALAQASATANMLNIPNSFPPYLDYIYIF